MSSLLEEELLALLSPRDFVMVPRENADGTVSSERTRGLKLALVERNALKPSALNGPPRNRCSSLTPGSVKFLQG